MSRDELVALVKRIMICDAATEEEHDALIQTAIDATPNGDISDLVFWPKREMTAEEIVDEALRCGAEWRRLQL